MAKKKSEKIICIFSKELYEYGIFSNETIKGIRDDYIFAKEHDYDKEKDDYEI